MAIPEHMLAELKQAQQLCDALQDQVTELEPVLALVASIQEKQAELESFYTQRWLEICESPELTDEDREALMFDAEPGKYSVLGEDTIWDVLMASAETQKQLLKELARGL